MSEIAGLSGSCVFSFLRNCQPIFQSDGSILHSHQQCASDTLSLHPCQHWELSLFLSLAILIGMYLLMV